MSRMHKPAPALPPDKQDKRSVIAIERGDIRTRLTGVAEDVQALVYPPSMDIVIGEPV